MVFIVERAASDMVFKPAIRFGAQFEPDRIVQQITPNCLIGFLYSTISMMTLSSFFTIDGFDYLLKNIRFFFILT